ncbi:MAG TPA: serine hydrolase [Blastocatellia bacterium]|nr:serine hydrolase [Blastocatellia bacterium]
MKLRLVITLLACAGLSLAPSRGADLGINGPSIILEASLASAPGASLPRSSPEAQGVSSAAILSFIEAADKSIDSLHSFMLLRHGQVVAEGWWSPYNAQSPHVLFSLSKSFTSTAIGLAISEGKLSVDDEVLKFFPDDAPAEPGANLKAMRVRDLLRMNTGHETEPPRPPNQSWKKAFLNHPVRFKPGTHFLYNTSATYMLAAIVEKTTGMSLLDYLRPRLFEPLSVENPTWEKSPEGITVGGYGLSVRTEDIARFGQLYLQKGDWLGKRLIPSAWVEEATSFQTSNGSSPRSDWEQGYGYQFWRCRNGAYRGDGAFGQYCVVLPKQDTVIAITSGLRDMQAVLNLVWEKLLPGLAATSAASDKPAQEKLGQALKNLSLRTPEGSASTPASLGKAPGQKYLFPANARGLESVALEDKQPGSTTIIARFNGVETRIECGHGAWKKGQAAWGSQRLQPVAASGAWSADDTFTAKLAFYETPFVYTVSLKFAGDELRYKNESNVGFGPAREPELVGKAALAENKH